MKTIIALLAILFTSISQSCFAFDSITVAWGKAEESTDVARIGLQKDFKRSWYQTDTSRLTGYWEVSLSHWDTDDKNGDDITTLTFSPVLAWRFNRTSADPYIELGVGVSYLTEDEIEDAELGGKFQFESRLGFGFRFGAQRQHDLLIRAIHVSNADIDSPNDGFDMVLLGYSYKF